MDSLTSTHQELGNSIRKLRRRAGFTQTQLAREMRTTQSVVGRIEQGRQNLSVKEIMKIEEVLGGSFLSTHSRASEDFIVHGGKKLSGTITTSTSKNGAMGLLCAALINQGTTTLHGIPHIEEVYRFIEIYKSIGVRIQWTGKNSLSLTPPKRFSFKSIDEKAARKTRTIVTTIGALVHSSRNFTLPRAGGCKLGVRTTSPHRLGFSEFGINVEASGSVYEISRKNKLKPADITLYEMSDTATEALLIAAAKVPGKTILRFASQNYMVQDVCFFLERLGVKIEGIGTSTLIIHGKKNIEKNIEFTNSEDPIEAMTLLSAGVVTNSEITVKRCPLDFLRLELARLEHMGLIYKMSKVYRAKNKRTQLVDITVYPSKLTAPKEKLHALPYPGINADNLPFFVPIATQARGRTMIHDWMYENRAVYFTELTRLNANITLADPHRVFVEGGNKLKGAEIVCPPALRPSTMVLIAMLGADGTSILRKVYTIKRGYENIVDRLKELGAAIEEA